MPNRKGIPNKRTEEYRALIREFAAKYDYDPVKAMIMMALSKSKRITPELKFKCHAEVAQYFASKLKSIDPDTGTAEERYRITVTLGGPDD